MPANWIAAQARRNPGKIAIRFESRELSYGALATLLERLAAALVAAGVKRGDCVAYLGLNSPEMLALFFSCARLGALFMPLNWRLAAPELRQMLEDCPPRVLIVEPGFVSQTQGLDAVLIGITRVGTADAVPGWLAWDSFLATAGELPAPDPEVGAATPLLISYTSGSTGKPKGVVLTHESILCNAQSSTELHALMPDDVVLTTLPMFHVGGLNILTTPALRTGCTLLLHPKFDAQATFDAIENEDVTLTVLVPAQLHMMMSSPRWIDADFSSLRMITSGSTIVPMQLIHAVHAKGVPLVQVYGSTETCPIAVYLAPDDARRKPGSTGRVARHCQLRLVDEKGADVQGGASGQILIKGSNVMRGYWGAPQFTKAVLRDGWYHSGDMGHQDEEGFLYVDGRCNDLIVCGGENIYPAEIENLLSESADIAEVSVTGRDDPGWGEIVVAVVVRKPGSEISVDQVRKLLDGRLARYKHPRQVLLVDALPKTALGKVRRQDVRRMVALHN